MTLTEHHDLRGGDPVWRTSDWPAPAADPLPDTCDVAIIGSGIMGAILAERLSADGHRVVMLDRRPSGHGSTGASTAQLMWAMDVPLSDLAGQIGADEAGRRWRRVHAAVQGLAERIDSLGVDCSHAEVPTLYLAGDVLDAEGLADEARIRRANGLPSEFLAADAIAERFGIAPRAALVSADDHELDPVRLTHGLIAVARGRGALLCHPHDVIAIAQRGDGVTLRLADGAAVEARHVVIAGGYERARLFLPAPFALLSTFVMATPPLDAPLWREGAMIWEASDPYLYVRATADGRVMAGGEDEPWHDSARRDALITAKAGAIAAKLEAMLDCGPIAIERAWGATFGSSPDGLPAIGHAANAERIWLAAGFGGNGIAFAALAAELLSRGIGGEDDPDAERFGPYRFG